MLLTACDDKYLSEAEILIKSCAKYEPDQRFYFFLVSSNPLLKSTIKTWHPDIVIECVEWPYDEPPRSGMLYCIRSIPLQSVLETYREPTIYLDSDTILRGSLFEIFKDLQTYDLLVKKRPELKQLGVAGTPYASTFNSGVIAIRPSEAGILLARLYNDILHAHIASGKPITHYQEDIRVSVYADQELLYVAYHQLKDQLLFKPLPTKFNDAKFDPDSIIWHGKGTARKNPYYVKEKLRHSHQFKYYAFSLYLWVRKIAGSIKRKIDKQEDSDGTSTQ